VGSLAALLYPDLGPVQVCRVLAHRSHHSVDSFLVAFFQPNQYSCYIPAEYLFRLEPCAGFPLYDEEQLSAHLAENPVSVDWLLERIFSAAQSVAVDDADILFPADQLRESALKPSPQQVQLIMFQCVSCAALLIISYLAAKWQMPKEKLAKVVDIILKTNPPKFASTQVIMAQIKERLNALLLR
jgi:hypothetical protein